VEPTLKFNNLQRNIERKFNRDDIIPKIRRTYLALRVSSDYISMCNPLGGTGLPEQDQWQPQRLPNERMVFDSSSLQVHLWCWGWWCLDIFVFWQVEEGTMALLNP
jgi:hypothetical protein